MPSLLKANASTSTSSARKVSTVRNEAMDNSGVKYRCRRASKAKRQKQTSRMACSKYRWKHHRLPRTDGEFKSKGKKPHRNLERKSRNSMSWIETVAAIHDNHNLPEVHQGSPTQKLDFPRKS